MAIGENEGNTQRRSEEDENTTEVAKYSTNDGLTILQPKSGVSAKPDPDSDKVKAPYTMALAGVTADTEKSGKYRIATWGTENVCPPSKDV